MNVIQQIEQEEIKRMGRKLPEFSPFMAENISDKQATALWLSLLKV